MPATVKVHPFEAAGLGVAPFRFVGMHEEARALPDGTVQPAGACDFCGTGIRYVFVVEDARGQRAKVGSDCVERTCSEFDATLDAAVRKEVNRVQREARGQQAQRRREKQAAAARADREATRELLAEHPALGTTHPHPYSARAAQGETLRDYWLWCLDHCAPFLWQRNLCAVRWHAKQPAPLPR